VEGVVLGQFVGVLDSSWFVGVLDSCGFVAGFVLDSWFAGFVLPGFVSWIRLDSLLDSSSWIRPRKTEG